MQDIYAVIGRMQAQTNYFRAAPHLHGFIPFLRTYQMVTEQVELHHALAANFYEDFASMAELDIEFAKLYFDPLQGLLNREPLIDPWENAFNYWMRGECNPFLSILLGINVHINADLPHALVNCDYDNEVDFEMINMILVEVIPKLMRYLFVEEHEILGLAGMSMRQFFIYEFRHIIVKWRGQAWQNAQLLRDQKITQDDLNLKTNLLSAELIEIWERDYNLLKLPQLIYHLNSTQVDV